MSKNEYDGDIVKSFSVLTTSTRFIASFGPNVMFLLVDPVNEKVPDVNEVAVILHARFESLPPPPPPKPSDLKN